MKKIYYSLAFLMFYLRKLVQSNLYIAYDILSPKMHDTPALIHVPLHIKSNFGLLLFTNLLSMTPGTLSIDITADKKFLCVHVLYNDKELETKKEIAEIEAKIKKIAD